MKTFSRDDSVLYKLYFYEPAYLLTNFIWRIAPTEKNKGSGEEKASAPRRWLFMETRAVVICKWMSFDDAETLFIKRWISSCTIKRQKHGMGNRNPQYITPPPKSQQHHDEDKSENIRRTLNVAELDMM